MEPIPETRQQTPQRIIYYLLDEQLNMERRPPIGLPSRTDPARRTRPLQRALPPPPSEAQVLQLITTWHYSSDPYQRQRLNQLLVRILRDELDRLQRIRIQYQAVQQQLRENEQERSGLDNILLSQETKSQRSASADDTSAGHSCHMRNGVWKLR
ncbi:unnamed protein product [Fusarium venenatum]|uniref:Uncharacterized protein n=1 Tax=Fusarium venenatum TaxID=56646 RepID=A0A2L2U3B9_9HYPO|nr:uncharacterized protein FVRRES_09272 [Fusarium venenatum]CEI69195.1 unnamed protein product [Fusarium venenatum]